MITDELKCNKIIKFGYQTIENEEEIFFAISTKHFKNFRQDSFGGFYSDQEMPSMSKVTSYNRYLPYKILL